MDKQPDVPALAATFLLVVPRDTLVKWVRSELGTSDVDLQIASALYRRGIDVPLWHRRNWLALKEKLADILNVYPNPR